MRTTRRQILGAALAVPALAQRKAPSVAIVIADGLTPSYLGCYGNRFVETPNLDRLAREGVRFTHAYTTSPSCSASRSVLLTGLQNHTNGQYGHAHSFHNFHLLPRIETLPALLKKKGYANGLVGTVHSNPASAYPFDYEDSENQDVWAMGQSVQEFLGKFKDRPFYLHFSCSPPHRKFTTPDQFGNAEEHPHVTARKYDPAKIEVPPFLPDIPEVRRDLAEYCTAISRADAGVGFVLDAIAAAGRAEETLVLFVTDHGMAFLGAKGSPYEQGMHSPLLVRAPGRSKAGTVNESMINFPDILPTVLEWTGAAGPKYPLHGRSFLPILNETRAAGWDERFYSHTFHEIVDFYPWRGICTRRFKYTQFLYPQLTMPLPGDVWTSLSHVGMHERKVSMCGVRPLAKLMRHEPEELYDLERDPYEAKNLAGSPEHAKTLAGLRQKVNDFRKETKDPWWTYFETISKPPTLHRGKRDSQ